MNWHSLKIQGKKQEIAIYQPQQLVDSKYPNLIPVS